MLRSPHPANLTSKTILLVSFWTVFSWAFSGCSVGDFIGAYFNTYYNAKRQFTEAEDELLSQADVKQKDSPFGFRYNVQPATKTKFTAVIEKCSKLLQYHPESNLVDDALVMIGKSYYYQNDYQPAERKFKELVEQFPTSDLVYESKLLLGYTYYMMNDKAKSSSAAKELLEVADKEGEDGYSAKASVLLAQLEVDNQNPGEAKNYYLRAADKADAAEERCSAYLNLAGLLSQEGNIQRALEAYRNAESASSTYQSMYKARLGQARMLSKLGAYEDGLTILRDLLSSTNFRESFGEISLEIGNFFKESKDYPSAIAQYTYVDTTYARTEPAANSYFQLGDLYETRLFLFDSAKVAYSKAKTEFAQATITQQASRRFDYISKYIQLRNEIRRLDSVKTAILSPPDTSHVEVAVVSDSTSDSLNKPPDSTLARVPAQPPMPLDSVNARLQFTITEMAALFYTSMNLPDSTERWYRTLLTEYPTCRQAPRALFTLAQIYGQDSTKPRTVSDSLYKELVDRFPESEFSPEAERILGRPAKTKQVDPAEVAYARAEKLFATDVESARDSLQMIVESYPSSPFASKSQYALGWLYETTSDQPDSAASSYRRLVELYPKSQYALLVKPKLDEYDFTKKALEQKLKDSISAKVKDSLSINVQDSLSKGILDSLKTNTPPQEKDDKPLRPEEQGKLDTPIKKDKE